MSGLSCVGVPDIWSKQHREVEARVSARSLAWLLPRPTSNVTRSAARGAIPCPGAASDRDLAEADVKAGMVHNEWPPQAGFQEAASNRA